MSIAVTLASCSDAGSRSENEDAVACESGPPPRWYAVLADGAGGHARGAEASRRVVARVSGELRDPLRPFEPATLSRALMLAHDDLRPGEAATRRSRADDLRRMHSTVVVLWGDSATGALLWSHVGDSRLYRVREGRCDLLTRDDSAIQPLVDAGLLSAEQAQRHPRRSQLLAALGMAAALTPTTLQRPASGLDGDAYLLCSDGWWECLTPDFIGESLLRSATPGGWLQAMRAAVQTQRLPNQDNFSAVAVWLGDPAATVMLPFEDTVP
jgi:PPM family protein phosphatase